MPIERSRAYTRSVLLFTLGVLALTVQYNYILFKGDFYPSLSLPRGVQMVREDDPYGRSRWVLTAVTQDGARIDVNPHQLLRELPTQYRFSVVGRDFGLVDNERASAADLDETRNWLHARVESVVGRGDVTALEYGTVRYHASGDGGETDPDPAYTKRIDF
jgi:hypothetical protein